MYCMLACSSASSIAGISEVKNRRRSATCAPSCAARTVPPGTLERGATRPNPRPASPGLRPLGFPERAGTGTKPEGALPKRTSARVKVALEVTSAREAAAASQTADRDPLASVVKAKAPHQTDCPVDHGGDALNADTQVLAERVFDRAVLQDMTRAER